MPQWYKRFKYAMFKKKLAQIDHFFNSFLSGPELTFIHSRERVRRSNLQIVFPRKYVSFTGLFVRIQVFTIGLLSYRYRSLLQVSFHRYPCLLHVPFHVHIHLF